MSPEHAAVLALVLLDFVGGACGLYLVFTRPWKGGAPRDA